LCPEVPRGGVQQQQGPLEYKVPFAWLPAWPSVQWFVFYATYYDYDYDYDC